jgi:hypothetical protein
MRLNTHREVALANLRVVEKISLAYENIEQ